VDHRIPHPASRAARRSRRRALAEPDLSDPRRRQGARKVEGSIAVDRPSHTRERDHMKKIVLTTTALVVAGAFALTGCSSERGGDTGAGTDTGDETAATGFDAGSTIGVALPDKTSENWVLAGQLFTDGLKEAGFDADVQYAPASNT